MWKLSLICLLAGSALFYGCTTEQAQFAEREYYLVEVIDSASTDFSSEVVALLTNQWQKPYQYYLTDRTAEEGWPYYGIADEDEEIGPDSLMIPHLRTHIFINESQKASKLLKVYLLGFDDSGFTFREEIYEWENSETGRLLVKTPIDHFRSGSSSSKEASEYIKKSAIRSTFK